MWFNLLLTMANDDDDMLYNDTNVQRKRKSVHCLTIWFVVASDSPDRPLRAVRRYQSHHHLPLLRH